MNSPSRLSSLSRSLHLLTPAVTLALPSIARGDAFLKIDSIVGESTNAKHPQWIEIDSFSFSGATQVSMASGKMTVGKPVLSEVTLSKRLDRSSGPLFLKCVQGQILPTVTLEVSKAFGDGFQEVYYKIVLTNVVVSSISTSGDVSGGESPSESLALTYSAIQIQYSYADGKGTLIADSPVSYNQLTGK